MQRNRPGRCLHVPRPSRQRIPELHRLSHAGDFILSHGRHGRAAKSGPIPMNSPNHARQGKTRLAAGPHPGAALLLFQYAHHQRCGAYHVCALHPDRAGLARQEAKSRLLVPTIVLQTIAANLGSMFTLVGNPQNLYLYSKSVMTLPQFLWLMFPYTGFSLLILIA